MRVGCSWDLFSPIQKYVGNEYMNILKWNEKTIQLYDTFIEYTNMFWFKMRIATNTKVL